MAGAGTDEAGALPVPAAMRGIGYSLISGGCFQGMNATVRVVSDAIHPFEIAFFRNLFGVAVLGPMIVRNGWRTFQTRHVNLHMLRAVLNIVAMMAAFYAISTEPLARFVALYFTAPLFASLGAILFLGEPAHGRRFVSLAIGFGGAMVVLRPGFADVSLGALATIFSAAVWAAALLVIKVLSRTDSSLTITSFAAVLQVPLALLGAVWVWSWPNASQLAWLAAVGAFGTGAQYFLAKAFAHADATLVLVCDFAKLLWAAAIGYFFFSEIPDAWTWVGGAIIFLSVTYIAHRERHLGQRAPGVGR